MLTTSRAAWLETKVGAENRAGFEKKPESPSLKSVQHGSLGSGRALRRQRLSEGKAVSQAAGEALQPG